MIIKSRAWVKPKGIFYYDFAKVPYDVKIEGIVYRCFSGRMDKGSLYEFDFEENLFTGLQDVNGKDIYEGDICIFHRFTESSGLEGVYESEQEDIVIIECQPEGIFLKMKEESNFILYFYGSDHEFKIIGNIYENPELIEASK